MVSIDLCLPVSALELRTPHCQCGYRLVTPIDNSNATGSIGRLQLRVPWSKLRREPLVVTLEDIVIRVGPHDDAEARKHT
jgi:hypothetical protein